MRVLSIPAGKNNEVVDKVLNDILHFISYNAGEVNKLSFHQGNEEFDPVWKLVVSNMDDATFPDVYEKLNKETDELLKKNTKV